MKEWAGGDFDAGPALCLPPASAAQLHRQRARILARRGEHRAPALPRHTSQLLRRLGAARLRAAGGGATPHRAALPCVGKERYPARSASIIRTSVNFPNNSRLSIIIGILRNNITHYVLEVQSNYTLG